MIGLIGISHQSALLEIREQLVISKEEIAGLYKHLNENCRVTGILALSTCNRTELYFETDGYLVSNTNHYLSQVTDAYISFYNKPESIKQYLYSKTGLDTARHLFRVATGLDSLILGEYQIVSQIKEAMSWVEEPQMIGAKLTRMVQKAFEAGKMVRTKTSINKGAVSVSSAAVELAGKNLGSFTHLKALTVGTGETGTIVAINLHKKGCKYNWVTNRTGIKAEQVAQTVDGLAIPYDRHETLISEADLVVYSTSAPNPLFTFDKAQQIMKDRNNRPLLIIDLCNPRNVDSMIKEIPDITLLDLDHMEDVVKSNFDLRKGELTKAESIIDTVLRDFDDWLNMRKMSSAISTIASTFKEINDEEVRNYEKVKNDEEVLTKIAEYGDHLSAKFSRMIIKQLREITNEGRDPEKVKIVGEFFNFDS